MATPPTVAITGARGALGQALLQRWHRRGARLIALTHRSRESFRLTDGDGNEIPLRQVAWQCGQEAELAPLLAEVDVLVLNHGVNPHARRDPEAVALALEVNALSQWRLLELFAEAVARREAGAPEGLDGRPGAEVWINTSEAEIQPALSPLYEISKRLMGQLLSLRALDLARGRPGGPPPLRLRRLVLGPFRSDLNPHGVMGADWVAGEILRQADWNRGLIIVTINPLTYVLMPLAALGRWAYFRCFSRGGVSGPGA
ncbi:MAG: NAD-dependent epimerase/dehydratase family protein [Cyanobacteriota bacterium]|nr:NAD-dependent epimerase/dehydratase family protein [Cyanobacteriota bacterium]